MLVYVVWVKTEHILEIYDKMSMHHTLTKSRLDTITTKWRRKFCLIALTRNQYNTICSSNQCSILHLHLSRCQLIKNTSTLHSSKFGTSNVFLARFVLQNLQIELHQPISTSVICDMIKGNESLVENFNSYFLAPLSHNCNMLHFLSKPHNNWISGYRVMKNLSMLKTI